MRLGDRCGSDRDDRGPYFSGMVEISRRQGCGDRSWSVSVILAPVALLCAGVLFVAIVALTRYVSLGSMVAAATIPLFVWLRAVFVKPVADLRPLLTAAIAGALLIVFAHRGNIGRLARGTESQI